MRKEKKKLCGGELTSFPPPNAKKREKRKIRRIACGEFPLSNSSRSPLLFVGGKDENECGQIKALFPAFSFLLASEFESLAAVADAEAVKGKRRDSKVSRWELFGRAERRGKEAFCTFLSPFSLSSFCPR